MQSYYGKQGGRLPRLQHVSLPITDGDQDKIRAFYGDLLGLKEKPVPSALAHGKLVWFEAGEGEMELHFIPDPYLANPKEGRHICLEVDDLEAYRSKLQDAGYPIRETTPIIYRPRFFTVDPCGNNLELTTILEDYRSAAE